MFSSAFGCLFVSCQDYGKTTLGIFHLAFNSNNFLGLLALMEVCILLSAILVVIIIIIIVIIITNIIVIVLSTRHSNDSLMCFIMTGHHTKFPAYERVVLRERKLLSYYWKRE